ncbi:hypothetical protein ZHAS_00017764 [Anopheles sinensis]|uniref:Phenoloxidase-activating factor 2 n=1 Tax=Anopheles sinensis TaxID=74873 RepID=A0A084WHQ7_ANOSI|nr:hypothetical protein ZHAS_00017764 [Anopheles sinensis]
MLLIRFGLLVCLCLSLALCEDDEEIIDNECEDYLLKCCPFAEDEDFDVPEPSHPDKLPGQTVEQTTDPIPEIPQGVGPTSPSHVGTTLPPSGTPTTGGPGTGEQGTGNNAVSKPPSGGAGGGHGSGVGDGKPQHGGGHGSCSGYGSCQRPDSADHKGHKNDEQATLVEQVTIKPGEKPQSENQVKGKETVPPPVGTGPSIVNSTPPPKGGDIPPSGISLSSVKPPTTTLDPSGVKKPSQPNSVGVNTVVPNIVSPTQKPVNPGPSAKPGFTGPSTTQATIGPGGSGSTKTPTPEATTSSSKPKENQTTARPEGAGTNEPGNDNSKTKAEQSTVSPSGSGGVQITTDKPITVPTKCGIRNVDGVGFRITGDNDGESEYGEFPWMVAILKEEKALDQVINVYQCGGSLIHPSVVLTAAHCVHDRKPAEVKARLGEWDTQTKNEIYDYQDRNVVEIVSHAEFNSKNLHNDVALLFLDKPAELMDTVNTICLPPADFNFDQSRCFASGWGKDVFGKLGKYQVILKKIELPVMPHDECQKALRTTRLGRRFSLHSSFICAGGEKGRDTCKGDGGSPLMCPIPGTVNEYYQAGMVAWGIGCGETGIPGVYVNVPKFRGWIDEHLTQRNIPHSYYIHT